jgi:hypothetical protein
MPENVRGLPTTMVSLCSASEMVGSWVVVNRTGRLCSGFDPYINTVSTFYATVLD